MSVPVTEAAERWVRDVARELPLETIKRELRRKLKRHNPDAYHVLLDLAADLQNGGGYFEGQEPGELPADTGPGLSPEELRELRQVEDEVESELADAGPLPPLPPLQGLEHVETYPYLDEHGALLFVAARYHDAGGGKTFRQARLDGDRWVWNLDGARRVLYRLPQVLEHLAENRRDPLYVVEGEKDVHAIEAAGGVATTNPMGAGKWTDEYAETLQGARRVIVVADRDETGRGHAAQVVESLARVGVVAELVEAAEGKDAADHLAASRALDELAPVGLEPPSTDVPEPFRIAVYSAAALATLEIPDPADPMVGPFVRRGMATLIGGLTGHGKTTWIAAAVKAAASGGDFLGHPVGGGERVLVLDLEQHLASIQRVIREAGLHDVDTVEYAAIPEGLALDKREDQLQAVEAILADRRPDLLVTAPARTRSARRSGRLAVPPACRCGRRTTCVTAGSACCTGRDARGRRSAALSASASSPSRLTRTRMCSRTAGSSTTEGSSDEDRKSEHGRGARRRCLRLAERGARGSR